MLSDAHHAFLQWPSREGWCPPTDAMEPVEVWRSRFTDIGERRWAALQVWVPRLGPPLWRCCVGQASPANIRGKPLKAMTDDELGVLGSLGARVLFDVGIGPIEVDTPKPDRYWLHVTRRCTPEEAALIPPAPKEPA